MEEKERGEGKREGGRSLSRGAFAYLLPTLNLIREEAGGRAGGQDVPKSFPALGMRSVGELS